MINILNILVFGFIWSVFIQKIFVHCVTTFQSCAFYIYLLKIHFIHLNPYASGYMEMINGLSNSVQLAKRPALATSMVVEYLNKPRWCRFTAKICLFMWSANGISILQDRKITCKLSMWIYHRNVVYGTGLLLQYLLQEVNCKISHSLISGMRRLRESNIHLSIQIHIMFSVIWVALPTTPTILWKQFDNCTSLQNVMLLIITVSVWASQPCPSKTLYV
jgi:hypothetical protein